MYRYVRVNSWKKTLRAYNMTGEITECLLKIYVAFFFLIKIKVPNIVQ